jgi:hypothetical protein
MVAPPSGLVAPGLSREQGNLPVFWQAQLLYIYFQECQGKMLYIDLRRPVLIE